MDEHSESIEYQWSAGDLMAIKRTQLGPGLKNEMKYLGPYKVAKTAMKLEWFWIVK